MVYLAVYLVSTTFYICETKCKKRKKMYDKTRLKVINKFNEGIVYLIIVIQLYSTIANNCPPGYYCSSGNINNAQPCPSGRYGNIPGQTSQSNACPSVCSSGRYGVATGKTNETDACPYKCSRGRYGTGTGKKTDEFTACPSRCPAGKYSEVTGGTTIDDTCFNNCPSGRYATPLTSDPLNLDFSTRLVAGDDVTVGGRVQVYKPSSGAFILVTLYQK